MTRLRLGIAFALMLGVGVAFAQVPPTGSGVVGWLNAIFNQLSDGGSSGPRTPITAPSGNVAAATATATLLAGGAGKTTYICGFVATGGGATAAAVVNLTVSNLLGGGMTYTFGANTGAGVPSAPLFVEFNPCQPAAVNTPIIVSMPSLGAGNTNAAINAWGYQR